MVLLGRLMHFDKRASAIFGNASEAREEMTTCPVKCVRVWTGPTYTVLSPARSSRSGSKLKWPGPVVGPVFTKLTVLVYKNASFVH